MMCRRLAHPKVLFFDLKKSKFQQYASGESHRGLQIFDNHLFTKWSKISLENPQIIEERPPEGFIVGVDPYLKNELWIGNAKVVSKVNPVDNTVEKTYYARYESPRFWTLLKTVEDQIWVGSYYRGLFTVEGDSLQLYSQVNEFKELQQMTKIQIHLYVASSFCVSPSVLPPLLP